MATQYISLRMSLIRKSFLFVREGLVYLCLEGKMIEIQTQECVGDTEKRYARSIFQMPTEYKYISQDHRIQSLFIVSVLNVSQGVSK